VNGILLSNDARSPARIHQLECRLESQGRGDGGVGSNAGWTSVLDRVHAADRQAGPVRDGAQSPAPPDSLVAGDHAEVPRKLSDGPLDT
jgi:hypothetical protein